MAKPKPTFCKNCGENKECKTFNKTGKACRKGKAVGKAVGKAKGKAVGKAIGQAKGKEIGKAKGKAIGKAIGKAKGKAVGKAISQETIDKRDDYDSLLGDLHTDYLNFMAQKQITVIYDIENGEKKVLSRNNKVYSFERWLTMNGHKTLASWFRRNFKGRLEKFNFKDFV